MNRRGSPTISTSATHRRSGAELTHISLAFADPDDNVVKGEQSADCHNKHTGRLRANCPELHCAATGGERAGGRGPLRKEAMTQKERQDMDEIEMIQASLDRMAEQITDLATSFRQEKTTNGGLSEESQEQFLAVKIAALQTQLALMEHGVPFYRDEGAA